MTYVARDLFSSGTFKNKATGKCEFCPARTYSDGTSESCSPCSSDLSLVPGLYFKNWNGLPTYLNGTYISFDKSHSRKNQLFSWRSEKHSNYFVPSLSSDWTAQRAELGAFEHSLLPENWMCVWLDSKHCLHIVSGHPRYVVCLESDDRQGFPSNRTDQIDERIWYIVLQILHSVPIAMLICSDRSSDYFTRWSVLEQNKFSVLRTSTMMATMTIGTFFISGILIKRQNIKTSLSSSKWPIERTFRWA